jgi:hypothetical protein
VIAVLNWEQRLLLERIVGMQKGTVGDIMLWTDLLKRLGFASDNERQPAIESYLLRAGRVDAAGLIPSLLEPQEYEVSKAEADRLIRVLESFAAYSAADYLLYASLLEAFGKSEPQAKHHPAWFELSLTLQTRLSVLLFLKQQIGPPAEALKLYRLADKAALTPEETTAIRYHPFPNGSARWDGARVADYSQDRPVCLTDVELNELVTRLQRHDQWSTADLLWLSPLLAKLEDRPIPQAEERVTHS